MGGTSEIRQRNLMDIIKTIRDGGSVTKPEISKTLGLTSITVHNYVTELAARKLIVEDGNAQSNGGRKAVLYKINPGFGFIVSQNIGIDFIDTGIYDMGLNRLYDKKLACQLKEYSEKTINMMHEEIGAGIRKLKFAPENCVGIGISVPGQVEHESGVVINVTNVRGWTGIPVKGLMEGKTGIPTFVDNDNNTNVLSAKWLGIVGDKADAVFISITSGIGTGILTKGKLLYGSHSSVGEIGHTTIKFDGPVCRCGNRGCIEALTSDPAVVAKVKGIKKYKSAFGDSGDTESDICRVVDLARNGDPDVYEILKETAGYIAIAIDHIIKLYGPEVIIINSKWLNEFPDLFIHITDRVFAACPWIRRESLDITLNRIKDIERIGPAALIFEKMFEYSEANPISRFIG